MSDLVLSAVEDGVQTITLNRPEKKNALTDAMYGQLVAALEQGAVDPAVRVVLIRGEGDAFTGGNDIGDFMMIAASGRPVGEASVFRLLKALARFEKPIVAAVHGFAVGIGVTLLLHCDMVIVADDAKLSTPFVNLALVPEAASTILLVQRIGHVRAYQMFALGEPVDGATAAAWGLANAVVPRAELDAAARKAAKALAARAPGSLRATKLLMREAEALIAQMNRENAEFESRLSSAEAVEAFTAFAQKRAPDFSKGA